MAFSELYVCEECGHDEVLVHAEEWAPGPGGQGMLPYPGSGPIGGLANRLWCPACRAVHPFAFVTLDPPGEHAVIAYAEAQRLGCNGEETGPCPECGNPMIWELAGQPCPACAGRGTFRFLGEWEDAV